MTTCTSNPTTQNHDEKIKAWTIKLAATLKAIANSTPRPTAATMDKIRPTIDAANAAASASTSTHWTGEAALRLYADVCRDIRSLAVRGRVLRSVPEGTELQVVAGIPARLTMATSRLVSEALPAIHNTTPDKATADLMLEYAQHITDVAAHGPLMYSHEALQSEIGQIEELERWGAQYGLLVANAVGVSCVFDAISSMTQLFAPHSNPQAALVALEANMHLDELKATLKHLATA